MNYKMILNTLGKLLLVEALMMLLPLSIAFGYKEGYLPILGFSVTIGILALVGVLLSLIKPKHNTIFSRDGFVIVGLSWIVMSLFGALPFVISKQIPNYINALFETVSGFTTTGASILTDTGDTYIGGLTNSMLFWRSFTHWVGGMGVLVFVLAVLPNSSGESIYLLKAEATGPQVGKLVSKVRVTARILYIIYTAMTVVETILLWCGDMNLFEAVTHAFGTAGTGGFGIYTSSIGNFSAYSQIIITIFMILFGINFNLFYLVIIGKIIDALKSEELRWYLGIILGSVIIITIALVTSNVTYTDYANQTFTYSTNVGRAIRDAFFQVASIITTTGYSTIDYNYWPAITHAILFILMFVGACAGSTGGGMKISRAVILLKNTRKELKKLIHTNAVSTVRFENNVITPSVAHGVSNYFVALMLIFFLSTLIVSIDGFDFTTNISAVAACLNNIGPGFALVGPAGTYEQFSSLSKIVLIFAMLVGRLEIYPMLILFNPKAWFNK